MSSPTSAVPDPKNPLKLLFEEALDLAPEARAAFVINVRDPALRAALVDLLDAHGKAGGFLESPTVEVRRFRRTSTTRG